MHLGTFSNALKVFTVFYSSILKRRLFRNSYQKNLFGNNALKTFKNSKATYSTISKQLPKTQSFYKQSKKFWSYYKEKRHSKIYRHQYNSRWL